MPCSLTRLTVRAGSTLLLVGALAGRSAAQYSIFRPVPHGKMRELTTDRPDKTESPITVDAGHVQIELDGLTWTLDRPESGMSVRQWSIAPVNMKVGLLDRLDLQLVLEPATREQVRVGGTLTEDSGSGFGEITARMKLNLWGDDSGKTAFGVMPFVTSTSVGGRRVAQGGIIFPLSIALSDGWDLGTMVEGDLVADEGKVGRRGVLVTSVTVGHALSERLGTYVEFYNEVSRRTPWIATADAGLTWSFGANVQFDAGINLGLSRAADDFNPFFGFSVRF